VHKLAGLLPFIAVCAAKDAREMHTRGGLQWALWFPVNMVAAARSACDVLQVGERLSADAVHWSLSPAAMRRLPKLEIT